MEAGDEDEVEEVAGEAVPTEEAGREEEEDLVGVDLNEVGLVGKGGLGGEARLGGTYA